MKAIEKGSRKIEMMKYSYACVSTIAILYFIVCAHLKVSPDAVVMSVFGALGGGHATANWANREEHKAK